MAEYDLLKFFKSVFRKQEPQIVIQESSSRRIDSLEATIQATIGVIDNWKVPLFDPDGKDSSEAVMRLLADDLRKVLEDG